MTRGNFRPAKSSKLFDFQKTTFDGHDRFRKSSSYLAIVQWSTHTHEVIYLAQATLTNVLGKLESAFFSEDTLGGPLCV